MSDKKVDIMKMLTSMKVIKKDLSTAVEDESDEKSPVVNAPIAQKNIDDIENIRDEEKASSGTSVKKPVKISKVDKSKELKTLLFKKAGKSFSNTSNEIVEMEINDVPAITTSEKTDLSIGYTMTSTESSSVSYTNASEIQEASVTNSHEVVSDQIKIEEESNTKDSTQEPVFTNTSNINEEPIQSTEIVSPHMVPFPGIFPYPIPPGYHSHLLPPNMMPPPPHNLVPPPPGYFFGEAGGPPGPGPYGPYPPYIPPFNPMGFPMGFPPGFPVPPGYPPHGLPPMFFNGSFGENSDTKKENDNTDEYTVNYTSKEVGEEAKDGDILTDTNKIDSNPVMMTSNYPMMNMPMMGSIGENMMIPPHLLHTIPHPYFTGMPPPFPPNTLLPEMIISNNNNMHSYPSLENPTLPMNTNNNTTATTTAIQQSNIQISDTDDNISTTTATTPAMTIMNTITDQAQNRNHNSSENKSFQQSIPSSSSTILSAPGAPSSSSSSTTNTSITGFTTTSNNAQSLLLKNALLSSGGGISSNQILSNMNTNATTTTSHLNPTFSGTTTSMSIHSNSNTNTNTASSIESITLKNQLGNNDILTMSPPPGLFNTSAASALSNSTSPLPPPGSMSTGRGMRGPDPVPTSQQVNLMNFPSRGPPALPGYSFFGNNNTNTGNNNPTDSGVSTSNNNLNNNANYSATALLHALKAGSAINSTHITSNNSGNTSNPSIIIDNTRQSTDLMSQLAQLNMRTYNESLLISPNRSAQSVMNTVHTNTPSGGLTTTSSSTSMLSSHNNTNITTPSNTTMHTASNNTTTLSTSSSFPFPLLSTIDNKETLNMKLALGLSSYTNNLDTSTSTTTTRTTTGTTSSTTNTAINTGSHRNNSTNNMSIGNNLPPYTSIPYGGIAYKDPTAVPNNSSLSHGIHHSTTNPTTTSSTTTTNTNTAHTGGNNSNNNHMSFRKDSSGDDIATLIAELTRKNNISSTNNMTSSTSNMNIPYSNSNNNSTINNPTSASVSSFHMNPNMMMGNNNNNNISIQLNNRTLPYTTMSSNTTHNNVTNQSRSVTDQLLSQLQQDNVIQREKELQVFRQQRKFVSTTTATAGVDNTSVLKNRQLDNRQIQGQEKRQVKGQMEEEKTVTVKDSTTPGTLRVVKNQIATLNILLPSKKNRNYNHQNTHNKLDIITSNEFTIPPGELIHVEWQLPMTYIQQIINNNKMKLVIALVRYASPFNHPNIVAKPIGSFINNRHLTKGKDELGNDVIRGNISFYTPKGAGHFIFRLFDHNMNDQTKMLITLGTSLSFHVILLDMDVTTNLKYSYDMFQDNQIQKGIMQLISTLSGIRNTGRQVERLHPQELLIQCMQRVFMYIEDSMKTIQELYQTLMEKETQKQQNDTVNTEEIQNRIRKENKLQNEFYDCLLAIHKNDVIFSLVPDPIQTMLENYIIHYCHVTYLFYHQEIDLLPIYMYYYKFIPAKLPDYDRVKQVMNQPLHHHSTPKTSQSVTTKTKEIHLSPHEIIDKQLHILLPTLLPSSTYTQDRLHVAKRIETALIEKQALPKDTQLLVYGSSYNNFGTTEADLDMCIQFPKSITINTETKPKILELIGQILIELGMKEVEIRSTARIPIVNFKDIISGLDCDIAFHNPLAIANTRLLRTYSLCDPRVRSLAYIIKLWVKNRCINNPGEGTLGSYGYILMLIHYLQMRPTPVVPNLQQLPPQWRGEAIYTKVRPSNTNNNTTTTNTNTTTSVHHSHILSSTVSSTTTSTTTTTNNLVSSSSSTINNNNNNNNTLHTSLSIEKFAEFELHPVDLTPCNIYFHTPLKSLSTCISGSGSGKGLSVSPNDELKEFRFLQEYGSHNKESIIELLLGFFHYYAWLFDYKHDIISIQGIKKKLMKAETCAWGLHSRISVEDPFETWYDVAHVIKNTQMNYIRKEFLRAYTIMIRALSYSHPLPPHTPSTNTSTDNTTNTEQLPLSISPESALELLYEKQMIPPVFYIPNANRQSAETEHATTTDDSPSGENEDAIE